jgi:hypothetical protein
MTVAPFVRRALILVLAAVASACSAPVPSTVPAAPSSALAGSRTQPSPGTGTLPASPASSDSGSMPFLVSFASDGTSLFAIDPTRSARRPLQAPPGHWTVTTGASSILLSSIDGTGAPQVDVVALSGAVLQLTKQIALPVGDSWANGFGACVSPSGQIVLADSGGTFYLAGDGPDPMEFPDQQNNRGSCTWLDDSHVLWDQEGGQMALWDQATNTTTPVAGAISGRTPSAGGSHLAWSDPHDNLVVNDFTVGPGGVTLGPQLGVVPSSSGMLSGDGRWLLAYLPVRGQVAVYDLSSPAFTVGATVTLGPDELVAWLPR